MPFIDFRTNVKVPEDKEILLKSAFGKDIATLPGKSESWLMVEISDDRKLYFKGEKDSPLAYIAVSVCASSRNPAYGKLTAALCRDVSDILGIAPDKIYVRYSEHPDWGWNGDNF